MPQKKNPSDLPLLCRTPVPFPTVPAAGRYGSRLTRCGQLPKFGWRIQPSGRFSPLRRSGDILPTSSLCERSIALSKRANALILRMFSQIRASIVLCKQKNKALVEITLPKDANIHAREYQLYLPSKVLRQIFTTAVDLIPDLPQQTLTVRTAPPHAARARRCDPSLVRRTECDRNAISGDRAQANLFQSGRTLGRCSG